MYPKATKVEKHVLSRAWESGVGIVKSLFNMKGDTAPEERFTPPSTEEMVKQCLTFYLEPYKRVLLNEDGYPSEFRINKLVGEVKLIFQQHKKPVVQHQSKHCAPVPVDNLQDVRKNMFVHIQ